eukprot:6173275-Alexandrium_andersonii.AAC.1
MPSATFPSGLPLGPSTSAPSQAATPRARAFEAARAAAAFREEERTRAGLRRAAWAEPWAC